MLVIVSARWSSETIELMPDALNMLKANSDKVIVLGPAVTYTQSLPVLLARQGAYLDGIASTQSVIFYDRANIIDQRFKQIVENSQADYVSLVSLMCAEARCRTMTESGVPIQWDYGHFTYEGAAELVKEFANRFELR